MSKKHFEQIAAALRPCVIAAREQTPTGKDGEALMADVLAGIADVLAENNPRFDRARFYKACGV